MPAGLKIKSLFFDKAVVINAMDAATRRSLSRIGAFLRTRARSSMRRRKRVAAAGQAPSVHSGQLKDLLFFSYDPSSKSLVVGPAKFRDGTAPRLLEFGGTISRRGRQLHYDPHPYMAPALKAEDEAGTIPRAWSGSLTTA